MGTETDSRDIIKPIDLQTPIKSSSDNGICTPDSYTPKRSRRKSRKSRGGQVDSDSVPLEKPTIHTIADNVYLYATRTNDSVPTFHYEVECSRMNQADLSIDFSNCTNMTISKHHGSMVVKCTSQPFMRTSVCQLRVINPTRFWEISFSVSVKFSEPDKDFIDRMIEYQNDELEERIAAINSLNLSSNEVISTITEVARDRGVSFIDPEFPPTPTSLYKTRVSWKKGLDWVDGGDKAMLEAEERAKEEQIVWRRPAEFSEEPFFLFHGDIEAEDITQGRLGDCWLLCAVAALAEFPHLVKAIFPDADLDTDPCRSSRELGMYRLRFCKNGRWQIVTVDDYFPCAPGGGPVYARSHGNELWAMLIEKAYAKLHGSYESLSLGWAYEAMMDMTGAPCTTFLFTDEDVASSIESGEFWNRLVEMDSQGYILSASTPGEDTYTTTNKQAPETGLIPGHAYTFIAAKSLSNGEKLVHIRNPWGAVEWKGDWSDYSPLWTRELRQELGDEFADNNSPDDGAFWMSYTDMLKHFSGINVCQVRTPGLHPNPWHEDRKKSFFVYECQSKKMSTYMFSLLATESCSAVFTIHQTDRRVVGAQPYIDIGITVLREVGCGDYQLVGSSGCTVERQAFCTANLLRGEKYVIVPCTTGAKFLQLDKLTAPTPVKLLNESGTAFTRAGDSCIGEVFDRLNMDMDDGLSRREVVRFLKATQPGMTPKEYRKKAKVVVQNFEFTDAGLTLAGFKRALLSGEQYGIRPGLERDDREKALMRDLCALGYDDDLNLIGSRGCVISVHSEAPVSITTVPFSQSAYDEAMELPILATGKKTEYESEGFAIYTKKNGYAGMSILAYNYRSDTQLILTVGVTGENILSHRGDLTHTVSVPPLEACVVHHLAPAVEPGGWSCKYSMSYKRV